MHGCAGWEWEGAWQVDKSSGEVDDEGWSYGSDFSMLTYPPPQVIPLYGPDAQDLQPQTRRLLHVRQRHRSGGQGAQNELIVVGLTSPVIKALEASRIKPVSHCTTHPCRAQRTRA